MANGVGPKPIIIVRGDAAVIKPTDPSIKVVKEGDKQQ